MFDVFEHIWMFGESYLTLAFSVVSLLTIDVGLFSIDLEIKRLRELRLDSEEKKRDKVQRRQTLSIRTKFNPF